MFDGRLDGTFDGTFDRMPRHCMLDRMVVSLVDRMFDRRFDGMFDRTFCIERARPSPGPADQPRVCGRTAQQQLQQVFAGSGLEWLGLFRQPTPLSQRWQPTPRLQWLGVFRRFRGAPPG